MVCQKCGELIDLKSLYTEFEQLFEDINEGLKDEVTPEEENVYMERLCVSCSKKLLTE